jgi:uncharacterized membrane protein YgdD (TMEM256/DUF423 family)
MASHIWLLIGAMNGLAAVMAGAYGRHGALDPAGREYFAIAAEYQMMHAVALLSVAWLAGREGKPWLSPVHLAGCAFTLGVFMFSGSLYGLAITGLVPVEGAAPAGGMLLILGWGCLIATGVRNIVRYLRLQARRRAMEATMPTSVDDPRTGGAAP